ncbi:hypothetical protein HD554DRAFT_2110746 [Boletus coccyginus]|nr:hypothetical protein HD554DRAFT_2110746 [Boletus coccyginus]
MLSDDECHVCWVGRMLAHVTCTLMSWQWRLEILVLLYCVVEQWNKKFLVQSYLRCVARISCTFGTLDVFSVYGLDTVYVPHQYVWFLIPIVCIWHLNSTGSLALLWKTQIYFRVIKGVCHYYRFNVPKLLFSK